VRTINTIVGLSLLAFSCVTGSDKPLPVPTDEEEETPPGEDPGLPGDENNPAGGGEEGTFDHMDPIDPWAVLDRWQVEGPPSYSAHVHSCMKMKYSTLGRVLSSRGVNLGNTTATSAGALYTNGQQAIGVATYAQRQAESTELTTAGASKILDIYASAAPEIIAQMPSRAECAVGGVNAQMFDASGACTQQGIECITGLPASPAQIELCSQIVVRASSVTKGRNMAVAVTMAAAQICE
jgi:hypothetical protein